jgi:hypothetical protein
MDTQTVDEEFAKLQTEFQDVATTVQTLAEKLQAAAKSGDANATEWLADLKQVASDIDDEQTQAKVLLLAVHGLISNVAQAGAETTATDHPPLYAPGHEPQEAPQQQQQPSYQQRGPMMGGGMLGGGMMGGGMMGGYFGGGFARAMEMGAGIGLGQSLISSIFR